MNKINYNSSIKDRGHERPQHTLPFECLVVEQAPNFPKESRHKVKTRNNKEGS